MLSNKIEQLRKEKGYTFAKLSELSGISTGRLSDLATGKRNNPTMDTLIKLADALDVTLDELEFNTRYMYCGCMDDKEPQ